MYSFCVRFRRTWTTYSPSSGNVWWTMTPRAPKGRSSLWRSVCLSDESMLYVTGATIMVASPTASRLTWRATAM